VCIHRPPDPPVAPAVHAPTWAHCNIVVVSVTLSRFYGDQIQQHEQYEAAMGAVAAYGPNAANFQGSRLNYEPAKSWMLLEVGGYV
jgi:hypothetical protein